MAGKMEITGKSLTEYGRGCRKAIRVGKTRFFNMKQLIKILLLFLFLGQLKAQVIPTNPLVLVSYDVEITTYKQVANNANLSSLTDFEKLEFKVRKEQKKIQKFLTDQNDITTVITYGAREGFEGTSESSIKKVVIDKNGIFNFGAQNQALGSQPTNTEVQLTDNLIKQNMTAEKFESIPNFSQPTPAMIQAALANGYQTTSSANFYKIKNATEEFTYNVEHKMLENKISKNGQPFLMKQIYYSENTSEKKIPVLKIEKTYDISTSGILIESVQVEKITNFIRTTR